MGRKEVSVFDLTREFRRQGGPGVNEWLVFSIDHAGNPIGLDKDGNVWICDHDAGVVQVIAKSFEEYLRKRCLKMGD
jgi:sugar lactone lactonase YvrE